MIHLLTQIYMNEFDLTEKQANYLFYITRFGFSTARILQLLNIIDGTKDMQGVYTRLKQLHEKKLIRYQKVRSLAGVKQLIYVTEKVKRATLENSAFVPAPSPKSPAVLRHNAIAQASYIMLSSTNDFINSFITANQVMSMKKAGVWRSKVADVVCFDDEKKTAYSIEVELNIKKNSDYLSAFNGITGEDLENMEGGWAQVLYFVDTQAKKKQMKNKLEYVKKNGTPRAKDVAEITNVMTIHGLQRKFNEEFGSNVDMEMFEQVL